jgi:hypothetical protein
MSDPHATPDRVADAPFSKAWDVVVTASAQAWHTYPPEVIEFKLRTSLSAMGLTNVMVTIQEPEDA